MSDAPQHELATIPAGEESALAPVPAPALPSEPRRARVTFFEDQAEVSRRVRLSLQPGAVQLNLQGVSGLIDDRSLRVLAHARRDEPVDVRAARVRRQISPAAEEAPPERPARSLDEIQRDIAAASRKQQDVEHLLNAFFTALSQCPPGLREEAGQAAWRESFSALFAALESAFLEWEQARRQAAEQEDQSARQRAESRAQRRRPPQVSASIEVELVALTPAEVELELSYRLPCALWRPEHLARLWIDPLRPSRGELELVTYALAWQRTGERWDNVDAQFSTARPARQATPPLLREDLLVARRRMDDAGLPPEPPPPALPRPEEMPGVNDGAPLSFEAAGPCSFLPSGRPLRVELSRVRLPCDVSRILIPEQKTAAYLRASATLPPGPPLLSAPARVALGAGLLGRASLGPVAPGEVFSVGFGPDVEVRARRRVQDQREIVPVVGVQRLRRVVEIYLSNLADEARSVEVVERLPLGETDLVEVLVTELGGAQLDTKSGMARYQVILAPKNTQRLTLSYEVRAAPRVRLNL